MAEGLRRLPGRRASAEARDQSGPRERPRRRRRERMSPRHIAISHADADSAADVQQRDADFRTLANQSALERAARDASQRKMAATLGRVPAHLRLRGLVTYD